MRYVTYYTAAAIRKRAGKLCTLRYTPWGTTPNIMHLANIATASEKGHRCEMEIITIVNKNGNKYKIVSNQWYFGMCGIINIL